MLCFYGEQLLARSPTPKMDDHPFFSPQLFIKYTHTWPAYLEAVPAPANWESAMPSWQGGACSTEGGGEVHIMFCWGNLWERAFWKKLA